MTSLSNILTLSRIAIVPVFLWAVTRETAAMDWLAFLLFIIAAVTDYYDGWAARKYGTITNLGVILDPVADKILTASAFLVFVWYELIPVWMVVIILAREFIITSIRMMALTQGQVLAAERSGKNKTISQMVAIHVVLFVICVQTTSYAWPALGLWLQKPGFLQGALEILLYYGPYWLTFLATLLSITSGLDFMWKNRVLFAGRKA